jgi:hypothetical protein
VKLNERSELNEEKVYIPLITEEQVLPGRSHLFLVRVLLRELEEARPPHLIDDLEMDVGSTWIRKGLLAGKTRRVTSLSSSRRTITTGKREKKRKRKAARRMRWLPCWDSEGSVPPRSVTRQVSSVYDTDRPFHGTESEGDWKRRRSRNDQDAAYLETIHESTRRFQPVCPLSFLHRCLEN